MKLTNRAYFYIGGFVGMAFLAVILIAQPGGPRFEQFPTTSPSPAPLVECEGA